jgi:hypothetical protein
MGQQSIRLGIGLCLFAVGCGPSINQAYKSEIDQRVAGLHAGGESFPASDQIEPLPLAVGQWTEIELLDAKKQPSFMTYKVVGQEGDAFWIETSMLSYTGKNETRMLINLGDRHDLNAVEIKAFSMRHDGKVTEYPSNMLGILKSVWKPFVNNLIIRWVDLPREDAQVPAGTFVGCYKQRTSVTFGPYGGTNDSWSSPAVPINGLVHSVGVDKPSSIDLIAFGTTGATSSF